MCVAEQAQHVLCRKVCVCQEPVSTMTNASTNASILALGNFRTLSCQANSTACVVVVVLAPAQKEAQ